MSKSSKCFSYVSHVTAANPIYNFIEISRWSRSFPFFPFKRRMSEKKTDINTNIRNAYEPRALLISCYAASRSFYKCKHYSLEPFFEYQISCNDRLLTLLSRTLLVFHYPSPINKLKVKIPAWKLHSRSDLLTVLKYPLLFRLLICHPNRHLFVLNVFFGVSL